MGRIVISLKILCVNSCILQINMVYLFEYLEHMFKEG